jgi:hypothetical protein
VPKYQEYDRKELGTGGNCGGLQCRLPKCSAPHSEAPSECCQCNLSRGNVIAVTGRREWRDRDESRSKSFSSCALSRRCPGVKKRIGLGLISPPVPMGLSQVLIVDKSTAVHQSGVQSSWWRRSHSELTHSVPLRARLCKHYQPISALLGVFPRSCFAGLSL